MWERGEWGEGWGILSSRKGKERKEIDRHVPREVKEMRKWADLWGMTNKQKVKEFRGKKKGGGGGLLESVAVRIKTTLLQVY